MTASKTVVLPLHHTPEKRLLIFTNFRHIKNLKKNYVESTMKNLSAPNLPSFYFLLRNVKDSNLRYVFNVCYSKLNTHLLFLQYKLLAISWKFQEPSQFLHKTYLASSYTLPCRQYFGHIL